MTWRKKVEKLMKEKNLNQKQLSEISGISSSSLSRYLKYDQRPRIDIILNLAKALDVKAEYLLTEESNESTDNAFTVISTAIARKGNELTSEEKTKLIALILGKV